MGIITRIKQKIKNKLSPNQKRTPPFLIKSSAYLIAGKESYHNGKFIVKGGEALVVIGNYCAFGNDIKIIKSNHNYTYLSIQYTFYNHFFSERPYSTSTEGTTSVIIGNNVWIGDNVIILPNVKIGDGACIAAGSIVTKDVDPYCIYGGVPAKKIKERFSPEITEKLKELDCWNWSEEKIKNNKALFFTDLSKLEDVDSFLKIIKE